LTEDEDLKTGTGNSNPKLAGRRRTYLTRTALGPPENSWRDKIPAPWTKSLARKYMFSLTQEATPPLSMKPKNRNPPISNGTDEETNLNLPRSTRLKRNIYTGHLSPLSPYPLEPKQAPARMGIEGDRRRKRIALRSPSLNCSSRGRVENTADQA